MRKENVEDKTSSGNGVQGCYSFHCKTKFIYL